MLLLPLELVGRTGEWASGDGRGGEEGGAAGGKVLGTSGQDLDRHRAEVEWPEGGSLVWSASSARQKGKKGGAATGILFG